MFRVFTDWLRPRSLDREVAFRERLIRIEAAIIFACILLSLIIGELVFHNEWGLVSSPAIHVYVMLGMLVIPLSLSRGKIDLAGQILVLICCLLATSLAVFNRMRYDTLAYMISPIGFLMTPIFAALNLPSGQIMRFTYLSVGLGLMVTMIPYAEEWIPGFSSFHFGFSYTLIVLQTGFFLTRIVKEAERRYHDAESAHQAQSTFLRLVNHELRTPLNSIIPLLDMYMEQSRLTPDEIEHLGYIKRNAHHLNQLVTKILNISKLESGGFQPTFEIVSIDHLLNDAITTIRPQLNPNVLLISDLKAEAFISADPNLLMEIFLNILGNAVKFTDAGSIQVRSILDGGNIRIEIADTGCGINDDSVVFREFAQTPEGKKRGGTGLGMPIAKRLVELHGGKIWFNSVVGQGTRFYIELPRTK
jgi:signal transduction histidine kinase